MGHTPGPWTVGEHRGVWVGPVVHADGKGVAFVVGSEDNARLIAAAPELLAALKDLRVFVSDNLIFSPEVAVADRAIAKAEGRSE